MLLGENQFLLLGENDNTTIYSSSFGISSSTKDLIINSDTSGSVISDGMINVWAPMRFSNIKIIFSYPEEEIMTDIYNHTLLTILMFIVLLVIFIVVFNHILKRLIEKPLRKIVNFNLAAINEEDTINNIASGEMQPNFDNMVHIIEQLIKKLNSGIIKLNTKNAELEGKNIEIEALYQQTSAMNITLHQYLEEIKAGYIVTVRSLSNAIEAKDKYTNIASV
jgi:hypothetical protein